MGFRGDEIFRVLHVNVGWCKGCGFRGPWLSSESCVCFWGVRGLGWLWVWVWKLGWLELWVWEWDLVLLGVPPVDDLRRDQSERVVSEDVVGVQGLKWR